MRIIKPKWPYANIVKLRAHMGVGQWYKTINGKACYFGVLRDPAAALAEYLARTKVATDANISIPSGQITLGEGFNLFLVARARDVESGSLSASQFVRYRKGCSTVLATIDRHRSVVSLTPADFDTIVAALKGSPRTVGNSIRDIRVAFKWISDTYDARPRYGQSFKRPSVRAVRAKSKRRELWTAIEVHTIMAHSEPLLRACILLGINCGFGQSDCASIRRDCFNLECHWFPRPKTGIERRCPFWPETIAAIACVRRWHPEIKRELLFLSKYGQVLVRDEITRDTLGNPEKSRHQDAIQQMLRRACKRAGVKYRPFYTFRHTFRSVADRVPDATAIKCIMGHALPGMDGVYVQLMAEDARRLKDVTNIVHEWLFGPSQKLQTS